MERLPPHVSYVMATATMVVHASWTPTQMYLSVYALPTGQAHSVRGQLPKAASLTISVQEALQSLFLLFYW